MLDSRPFVKKVKFYYFIASADLKFYKPKLRSLHSFNFFQKLLSSNFKRAIPNYRFQRKIGKADELKIMKNNEAT